MTYLQFSHKFSTTGQVIDYYISVRYPKGLTCNHCGGKQVYPRTAEPRQFDCEGCKNSFSVFKGTIFEKSRTDLKKWMYAFHIFLNGKKGISGYQLQREIGVTYKCAWRMLKQIRLAMGNEGTNRAAFNAIVEIDETYVGGKPRKSNKRDDDKKNKRGRGTNVHLSLQCKWLNYLWLLVIYAMNLINFLNFRTRSYQISARITDAFFNDKIDKSEVRFAKGDRLVGDLVIQQSWDDEYHAWVNRSYAITIVREFYRAPTQEKFDFGRIE